MNRNNSATEALIPPAVMEKWFDLVDAMVGADSFTGGISLARSYQTIFNGMGFGRESSAAKARYNMAHMFLTALVQDPENVAENTTCLYVTRLSTRWIWKKPSIEPGQPGDLLTMSCGFRGTSHCWIPKWSLHTQSGWLLVRRSWWNCTQDSVSGSANLGGARISPRASGVRSLDRICTIHPVSFEPGNWYRYVLPKCMHE